MHAHPILYVSADATGMPMRPEELVGRAGKQHDGGAKTRSAYLGCVFTQHKRDEKGRPIRDYESTTYVSHMGPLEEFGPMLRQEALRRDRASRQSDDVIDGAPGLENMGRSNFPGSCKSSIFITVPTTPVWWCKRCWGAKSTQNTRPGAADGSAPAQQRCGKPH